ncbi:M50 family metallopeptidase [Aliikangiella sp. IMCC44359]|uniref:M50 family metallopeptidase n=1 Tax=Aliikangiella sp. IMCC44359 TaxID=3459125 RepID=UPI00403AE27F
MIKNKRSKDAITFLVLSVLIFFLWSTPLLYPLKILVVFFHESSHAIATIVTGGEVKAFEVVAQAGGHVISRGGNRFITLSSGYLGSLVWGLVIFSIAVSTHLDRWLMGFIASILITITILYGSNSFVIIFGISMGIAMLLSAKFLSVAVNDFLLRLIGLTNILYVPLDIYSDTIARSHLRSDAFMLAEEFGGTTLMWGGIWLAVSILCILICLRWLLKTKSASTIYDKAV